MELVTHGMRPSTMMSPRQARGTVLAVLLCSGLAGCGSITGSAAAGAAGSAAATASSSAPVTSSAPAVGCASANLATSVTVLRIMHLVEPSRMAAFGVTQHNAARVRALFGQFCRAVGHADTQKGVVRCPADFGTSYTGTFYDGSRALARFVYGASGCQTVSITAGGTTRSTMLMGPAAAAAPKLRADMAAVLGQPTSMLAAPPSQVNPAGPNKPLR
jgi:hypothetical protein